MQTQELDPKKIKLWNWYNKQRQEQYGIIRPQTGWEKLLGFAGKIIEPETYTGLGEKVSEWAGKGWQEYQEASKELPERMAMESGERFDFLADTYIKKGIALPSDDQDFLDRYLERHVMRPPGFTAEQWLKQPQALQKGYNYAVLATILAMPLASVITHPTFGPRVKFALNKLYKGKPPNFTKVVTKGYSLAGKPETKVTWQAIKPAGGAASVTREAAAEFTGIKPAVQKTFQYAGLKSDIYKQLDEVVAKIKGVKPTSIEMMPFRQLANEKLGPAGPFKGLLDPNWIDNVYSQINKALPAMLVNFKPIVSEEAIVEREMKKPLAGVSLQGEKFEPPEKVAPEVAPTVIQLPKGMTYDEFKKTEIENPAFYNMVAQNESPEAARLLMKLHLKGVGTLETHQKENEIAIRFYGSKQTINTLRSQPNIKIEEYPFSLVSEGQDQVIRGNFDALNRAFDQLKKESYVFPSREVQGEHEAERQSIYEQWTQGLPEVAPKAEVPSYMEQEMEMFSGIPLPKSARDYLHRMTEPARGIPLTADKVFIQWNADSNEAVMQGKVLGDEWKRKVKENNLSTEDTILIDKYMELPAEYADQITAEQKVIADWQAQIYGKYHEIASNAGLLDEFIENYVPHMYKDSPEKVRKILFPLISRRSLSTRPFFTRKRTIPTADEAEKLGLHPIRDGGIKLQVYTNALFKTLANKKLIDVFQNMNDKDGLPLIMRSDKAPRDYKIIRHRSFDRFMWIGEEELKEEKKTYLVKVPYSAHPELADKINNLVDPSIPYNKWMRYLVGAQGVVKRLVMYNPLIHGWNIYSDVLDEVDFNAVKAFNIVFRGQVPEKLLKQFEFKSLDELDLDSVKHGLSSDAVFGATNELYANMQKLEGSQVSKWLLPLIKVRDFNDKILWQRMVLSSQRSIYLNKLSQLVKENPKVSVDELKWQASHFTNDLLGTLPSIIFTKNETLVTRLFLFARNWTISNLRLITGSLGEYGTSKLMPGPLRHKGLTKEEANRIAPHYRRHLIKGIMALVLGVTIVNSGIKSIKEGKPTAWWPWEAEKGHWLDIDTQTRDKKGRKNYVKPPLFRYMGDYIGYGTDPMQTIYNKAEPVLKQGAEQFMNYSKWRRGPITEAEGVLALKERFDYALGGLTPFGTLYGVTEERKTPLEKYIPLTGTWIRHGVSPELYQRLGWLSKDDRKKFEGTLSREETTQLRRTERKQKYGRTLSEDELNAASKLAQKYFDWSKKRRVELRQLDKRIDDLILSGKLYEAKRLMREEDRYKLPDRERKMRERINRVLGGTGAR